MKVPKQNEVHTYNKILFSQKNKWSSDTYYKEDKPWKHAKWEHPDTEGHIFMIPFI